MLKTASRALLDGLAADRRRVFAAWRALILLRRATLMISPQERRWSHMPRTIYDLTPVLNQMRQREEIAFIEGRAQVYEVTVPYAVTGPLDEYEVLLEIHPYAALSHISAFAYHGLTDDLSKEITMTASVSRPAGMLPSGTTVEDWDGVALVSGSRPSHVLDRPIHWTTVKPERYFGISEYRRFEFPIRVTDRERTLLDGLRAPELCGGLENVFRAWVISRDILNIGAVVQYVDTLDINVLRQRAGFVLDKLHLTHPALSKWRVQARRGGSSKLLSSAPYSSPEGPRFSADWNLSLNASIDVLEGMGI
jgi:predicted transcriptional regulator of viral defense system